MAEKSPRTGREGKKRLLLKTPGYACTIKTPRQVIPKKIAAREDQLDSESLQKNTGCALFDEPRVITCVLSAPLVGGFLAFVGLPRAQL